MSKKKHSQDLPDNFVGGGAAILIGILGIPLLVVTLKSNGNYDNRASAQKEGIVEDYTLKEAALCKEMQNDCKGCVETGCQFCQGEYLADNKATNIGKCVSMQANVPSDFKCVKSPLWCPQAK